MHASPTLLGLLIAVTLSGCGSPGSGSSGTQSDPGPAATIGAVAQLDPADFAAAVAEPERVTVNVHVPYDGQVDGTDLFVPYDRLAGATDLPTDRSTPLAVYCLSGRMSALAVAELTRAGYTDVVELAGGMRAWQRSGRPITRSTPPPP